MNRSMKIVALAVSLAVALPLPAQVATPAPAQTPPAGAAPAAGAKAFSQQELDQLLAPIALHPDALLAQVLMASTYPLEIVAASWSRPIPGSRTRRSRTHCSSRPGTRASSRSRCSRRC